MTRLLGPTPPSVHPSLLLPSFLPPFFSTHLPSFLPFLAFLRLRLPFLPHSHLFIPPYFCNLSPLPPLDLPSFPSSSSPFLPFFLLPVFVPSSAVLLLFIICLLFLTLSLPLLASLFFPSSLASFLVSFRPSVLPFGLLFLLPIFPSCPPFVVGCPHSFVTSHLPLFPLISSPPLHSSSSPFVLADPPSLLPSLPPHFSCSLSPSLLSSHLLSLL